MTPAPAQLECPRRPAGLELSWRDFEGAFWQGPPEIHMELDNFGTPVPDHRTEVRIRWTREHLYFLFHCPYQELHLKPSPQTHEETFGLWNWDVAEVFISADFQDIRRYREFEVSPQGEWIDLDVDLTAPCPEDGWLWRSGMEAAASIDGTNQVWYGAMRIPYGSIDARPAEAGNALRMNLFRSQGSRRLEVVWHPTRKNTFHVPEVFGTLHLAG